MRYKCERQIVNQDDPKENALEAKKDYYIGNVKSLSVRTVAQMHHKLPNRDQKEKDLPGQRHYRNSFLFNQLSVIFLGKVLADPTAAIFGRQCIDQMLDFVGCHWEQNASRENGHSNEYLLG